MKFRGQPPSRWGNNRWNLEDSRHDVGEISRWKLEESRHHVGKLSRWKLEDSRHYVGKISRWKLEDSHHHFGEISRWKLEDSHHVGEISRWKLEDSRRHIGEISRWKLEDWCLSYNSYIIPQKRKMSFTWYRVNCFFSVLGLIELSFFDRWIKSIEWSWNHVNTCQ